MWCRRGHFHKDCLEKIKENSTLQCCNCTLTEVEKCHPLNYHGCSHAKDEFFCRTAEQASMKKNPTVRVFSSRYVTLTLSFITAVYGDPQQGRTE
jgi:hypothetical protein